MTANKQIDDAIAFFRKPTPWRFYFWPIGRKYRAWCDAEAKEAYELGISVGKALRKPSDGVPSSKG
jgi:hypothetical protein